MSIFDLYMTPPPTAFGVTNTPKAKVATEQPTVFAPVTSRSFPISGSMQSGLNELANMRRLSVQNGMSVGPANIQEAAINTVKNSITLMNQKIVDSQNKLREHANHVANNNEEMNYWNQDFKLTAEEQAYIQEPVVNLSSTHMVMGPALTESFERLQAAIQKRMAVSTNVPRDRSNPNGLYSHTYHSEYDALVAARGTDDLGMSGLFARFEGSNNEASPDWNRITFDFNAGDTPTATQMSTGTVTKDSLLPTAQESDVDYVGRLVDEFKNVLKATVAKIPNNPIPEDQLVTVNERNNINYITSLYGFDAGIGELANLVTKKKEQLKSFNTSQTSGYDFQMNFSPPVRKDAVTSEFFAPVVDIDSSASPETYLGEAYAQVATKLKEQLTTHFGPAGTAVITAADIDGFKTSNNEADLQAKLNALLAKVNTGLDDSSFGGDGKTTDYTFSATNPTMTTLTPISGKIPEIAASTALNDVLNQLETKIQDATNNSAFVISDAIRAEIAAAPDKGQAIKEQLASYSDSLDLKTWTNDPTTGKKTMRDVNFTYIPGDPYIPTTDAAGTLPETSASEALNNINTVVNDLLLPTGENYNFLTDDNTLALREGVTNAYRSGDVGLIESSLGALVGFLNTKLDTLTNADVNLNYTSITAGQPDIQNRPEDAEPLANTAEGTLKAIEAALNNVGVEFKRDELPPDIEALIVPLEEAYEAKDAKKIKENLEPLLIRLNELYDKELDDVSLVMTVAPTQGEEQKTPGKTIGFGVDPELGHAIETFAAITTALGSPEGLNLQTKYPDETKAIVEAYEKNDLDETTGINPRIRALIEAINQDPEFAGKISLETTGAKQGETIKGTPIDFGVDPELGHAAETFAAITTALGSPEGLNLQTKYPDETKAIVEAYEKNDLDETTGINPRIRALIEAINQDPEFVGKISLAMDKSAALGVPSSVTTKEPLPIFGNPDIDDAIETLAAFTEGSKELMGAAVDTFDLNDLVEPYLGLKDSVEEVKDAYANPDSDYGNVNLAIDGLIAQMKTQFNVNGAELTVDFSRITGSGQQDSYKPALGVKFSEPMLPPAGGSMAMPAHPVPAEASYTQVGLAEAELVRKERFPLADMVVEKNTEFTLDQTSTIALSNVFNEGHPEKDAGHKHRKQLQWDEAHSVRVLDAEGKVVAEMKAPDFSPTSPRVVKEAIQKEIVKTGIEGLDLTAELSTITDRKLKNLVKNLDEAFKLPRTKRFDEIEKASQAIEDHINDPKHDYQPTTPINYVPFDDAWMTSIEEFDVTLEPGKYTLQISHDSPEGLSENGDTQTAGSRHVKAAIFARPVPTGEPGHINGTYTTPTINPGSVTPTQSTIEPGSVTPSTITKTFTPGTIAPGRITQTRNPGTIEGTISGGSPSSFEYSAEAWEKTPGEIKGEQSLVEQSAAMVYAGASHFNVSPTTPSGSHSIVDFNTPLILDLNGNGFQLTSVENGVHFDMDGDGYRELISWTKGGQDTDGFLVMDKNGNGQIDDGSELFGEFDGTSNGFAQLARHDSNGDGKISKKDEAFKDLKIWKDKNHNGTVEAGEMQSLWRNEIKEISLNTRVTDKVDEHGNGLFERASFTRRDGSKGTIVDAILKSLPTSGPGAFLVEGEPPAIFRDYLSDELMPSLQANSWTS